MTDQPTRAPGPAKANTYGRSEATPKPEKEQGKYDKPARAEDDFAIDELREKPIRGRERPAPQSSG